MKSIDPATGETIATYRALTPSEVDSILNSAHERFKSWHKTEFAHRSKLLKRAAEVLRERKEQWATVMTQEMGKVTAEAIGEVEKCAWVCEYYAEHAESFLQDQTIDTDMSQSFVTYQPMGVILAVMPWNFPFWQVFRFAAPALMVGNVAVLKHASNVCGCALAIEEIFNEAGFPPHTFSTLLIPSDQVERVINNPIVRAVTLTGSVPAGRAVASTAGKALKKTVLELGGSDAYLILEDADIELAVKKCAQSRLLNAGQSCIAAKRFIVVGKAYDKFVQAFVKEMESYKLGAPGDEDTDIGPQASIELRDELQRQVDESVRKGAVCLLGGKTPSGPGAYYPPTVLTNVQPGMPAYNEELFGPVASIIKVSDEDEALRVANSSRFGLGGAIFTQDTEKGIRLAREEMDTGFCAINDFVKSDPRLPFGGVKDSGYGRELSSFGIREFVNIKTVVMP